MLLFFVRRSSMNETTGFWPMLSEELAGMAGDRLTRVFVPVFAFVEEDNTDGAQLLVMNQMDQIMPLYGYGNRDTDNNTQVEDRMTIEMILMAEAGDEGGSNIQDDFSDGSFENGAAIDQNEPATEGGVHDIPTQEEDLQTLLAAENEAAVSQQQEQALGTAFVPHEIQTTVDLDSLQDYEILLKNFYTIDKTTMAGSDQLNLDSLLGKDMTISKEEGPQILIYHTHSQEAFADSIPGDTSTTIVGVGERLTQILTQEYGYQVLHHMGQYDVESRDDAYSRALPDIEKVLEENPSIQVVIDLHRDAMAEETHLVMDLDGRPTARFMFFNGLSRTRKTGNISYLYNENLEGNLAFSFQMQMKAVQYYPGLTRKIYLKGYRYNMHLRPRTLLIELGAQNNTVEEAMNACDPIAHILDMVLSGQ